jgi:hypothetical protein
MPGFEQRVTATCKLCNERWIPSSAVCGHLKGDLGRGLAL